MLNFREALAALRARMGEDFQFQVANDTRTQADYALAPFLPIRNRTDYIARGGWARVIPTMAGLMGMDSTPGPIGAVESVNWFQEIGKIGGKWTFREQQLRELQAMVRDIGLAGGDTVEAAARGLLNYLGLINQAHDDTIEYLRGKALTVGAIDWTYNDLRLQVDYQIPSGNLFAQRTGTAGYGGTASVFWADIAAANTKLGGRVRVRIARSATIQMIINNPANNIEVRSMDDFGSVEVTRLVTRGGLVVRSSDARETTRIVAYDRAGNVLDPANPGQTIEVPFIPTGLIVNIGDPSQNGIDLDGLIGAQEEEPDQRLALGYVHRGPAVELSGRTGRYVNTFVDPRTPYQIETLSAENVLPVLPGRDRLVVMSTVMV